MGEHHFIGKVAEHLGVEVEHLGEALQKAGAKLVAFGNEGDEPAKTEPAADAGTSSGAEGATGGETSTEKTDAV